MTWCTTIAPQLPNRICHNIGILLYMSNMRTWHQELLSRAHSWQLQGRSKALLHQTVACLEIECAECPVQHCSLTMGV